MPLTIKNKFAIGELVYVSGDTEQTPRPIVYIVINPNGLMYGLRMDGEIIDHFEIELSAEPFRY